MRKSKLSFAKLKTYLRKITKDQWFFCTISLSLIINILLTVKLIYPSFGQGTNRSINIGPVELSKDPTANEDVYLSISIDGSEPLDIYKSEMKLILKTLLGGRENLGTEERFDLHLTEENVPQVLFDKFSGDTWIYVNNKFIRVDRDYDPRIAKVDTPTGELIDILVDRTAGYTLSPRVDSP